MFDRILNVTLSEENDSTAGVTQGNLEPLLSSNSHDSHQHKNNKMKSWPEPTSSSPLRITYPLRR